MRTLDLHTVCESARCPNMGECWDHGTATFMILGDICTRACGFCAVPSGKPAGPPDEEEPFRVAEAVARMGLRYAVVTSVNRDDQPDGGAHIFARTIEEIRRRVPGCKVEVLIPDFRGDWNALNVVLATRPDVLNHNTETVPRLYRQVRKGAVYERSLELLRRAKETHPDVPTKTGSDAGARRRKRRSPRHDSGSRRARHGHSYAGPVSATNRSICRSFDTCIPTNSPSSKCSAKRWASNTSKPARSCAPRITPSSKPNPPTSSTGTPASAHFSQSVVFRNVHRKAIDKNVCPTASARPSTNP